MIPGTMGFEYIKVPEQLRLPSDAKLYVAPTPRIEAMQGLVADVDIREALKIKATVESGNLDEILRQVRLSSALLGVRLQNGRGEYPLRIGRERCILDPDDPGRMALVLFALYPSEIVMPEELEKRQTGLY